MIKIQKNNPENTKNFLKPTDKKILLILIGIKLALALAGGFAIPMGHYSEGSALLLRLLAVAFVYDICCFYQVCLHIAQSIFIAFLLFILLLMGGVFLFNHFFSFLAAVNPSTEAGQNLSMAVMTLIFLIPFLIDAVRLARLWLSPKKAD